MMLSSVFQENVTEFSAYILKYTKTVPIPRLFKTFYKRICSTFLYALKKPISPSMFFMDMLKNKSFCISRLHKHLRLLVGNNL